MSALAEPKLLHSAAKPAVFIDRRWLEALRAAGDEELATAAAVLRRLRDAGHRIVVASNESRVASGEMDESAVQADDRDLAARLALSAGMAVVDRFYWCPFDPAASVANYRRDHAWRKPRPGMLLQAASDLELDLERSWVIAGDEDDLAAARAAGCRIATIGRLAHAGDDARESAAARAVITSGEIATAADAILGSRSTSAGAATVAPAGECDPEPSAVPSESTPTPVVELFSATSEGVRTPMAPSPPIETAPSASRPIAKPPDAKPSPAPRASTPRGSEQDAALAGTMRELAEELRLHRQAARDLTGGRVLAIVLQLGVLLTAVMGLLQLDDSTHFTRWFLGAILLQATAIALLLFDRR